MSSIYYTFRQIGYLTIALTFALMGNFAYSAWSNPTAVPTGGNTYAPINTGPALQLKEGNLAVGNLRLNNDTPTILLNDLNADNGWRIRGDSGMLDFVKNNGTIAAPVWKKIATITDDASGARLVVPGKIWAGQYCDKDGNNCIGAPTGGGPAIDTTMFINTGSTTQTKAGTLIIGDTLRAVNNVRAMKDLVADNNVNVGNKVRSPEYCDATGNNCFEAVDVTPINTANFLNTGSTTQTKAGSLIVGNNFRAANNITANQKILADVSVNSDSYCARNGTNCFTAADVTPINTANFINTSAAAQTKAGTFTANRLQSATAVTAVGNVRSNTNVIADQHLIAENQVRSNQYCARNGSNCFSAADVSSALSASTITTHTYKSRLACSGSNTYGGTQNCRKITNLGKKDFCSITAYQQGVDDNENNMNRCETTRNLNGDWIMRYHSGRTTDHFSCTVSCLGSSGAASFDQTISDGPMHSNWSIPW